MTFDKEFLGEIVVFLVSNDENLTSKYENIKKENFELIVTNQLPKIKVTPKTPKISGDNIIFVKRVQIASENGSLEEELTYLTHRNKPEKEYNWLEVSQDFADNYFNFESENGFWRWGQIVPEDGSYLCRDCGFIGDFVAGEIFPICDVCLDGDPGGPIPLSEGYWELV